MRFSARLLVALFAIGWGACADDTVGHDLALPDQAIGPDLGGFDLTAGGAECTDPRATPYMPDLAKTSAMGAFHVTMVVSEPGPPIIGNSAWIFDVTDAKGAPVLGATLASKPWMPDHGHGTSVKATPTEMGNGRYTLFPLYLFMAGLWETTITITAKDGTADTVVFSFCLAES